MIQTDSHLHTYYSPDSQTQIRPMIEQAVSSGLTSICFTDHMDLDFPDKYDDFTFDTKKYWQELQELQELYKKQIQIRIGIEFGLQPHLKEPLDTLRSEHLYDFVIGSTHLIGDWDPYHRDEHPELTAEQVTAAYFSKILENFKAYQNVHTLGHLDYIVRYVEGSFAAYDWKKYREQIEPILKLVIEKGIALEVNTSGYRYSDGHTHPHPEILKWYRELGGELLTIGSDAHIPGHVAIGFGETEAILNGAGFTHYAVFCQGKPEFHRI